MKTKMHVLETQLRELITLNTRTGQVCGFQRTF